MRHQNSRACHNITKDKIIKALRNMKLVKTVGLDRTLMEILKCLGDESLI